MQRLAAFPHESATWLQQALVIDCGGPLAPNTAMSCLLAYTENTEMGHAQLPDGRRIVFYFLVPLYPEERDLEKREGTPRLLGLLRDHGFDKGVAIGRPNLALSRQREP